MSELPDLRTWFKEYAEISQGPQPEALAQRYAESFLVAAPNASAAFQNDERFQEWLRRSGTSTGSQACDPWTSPPLRNHGPATTT